MRRYEFMTAEGLPYQAWLITRQEQKRCADMMRRYRKENPKSTLFQDMVAESLIRLHIWEQRLTDRRFFFDGERTDYAQVRDHEQDVSTDDLKRKAEEFGRMMPVVMRWKSDLLKIAMANAINVNVDGDLTQLFAAMDRRKDGSNGAEAQNILTRRGVSEL